MKNLFCLFLVFPAFIAMAQAPSNGLLHYYPFDNTLTGSGGHTLAGGTGNYVNDRFGNTNRAHNVATAANAFQNAGIPSLPTASIAARSFCFWYKSNSNTNHALFNYGGTNNYWGVSYNSSVQRLEVISGNGSGGVLTPVTHNITYTGNWTHVAVVYSGTQVTLYVNGSSVGTANFGAFVINPSTSRIGYTPFNVLSADFQIDDLFFYDRALTAQEVTTLYEFCNAPSSTTPAANLNICGGNTTTLSTTTASTTWYDAQTGGNVVGTGSPFTTPVLNSNTTYWAQGGSCPLRLGVNITVTPIPTAPTDVTTNNNKNRCAGGVAILTVTSGATVSWFDVPTGGTALGTGNQFITPTLPDPAPNPSTTVTYYAQASNSCGTSSRTAITVTSHAVPAAPVNTTPAANLSICSGATTTLSVSVTTPSVEWYIPGQLFPINTTTTYTTPALTQNTTYQVYARTTFCVSAVTPITVTVSSPASAPTNTTPAANLSVCVGTPTTLTASGSGTLYWFDAPTGGNQLDSGTTFNTPAITTNTTYYVQSGIGNCASSRTAIAITALQPPAVPVSNTPAANLSICEGSGTTLSVAAPPAGISTSWWASQTAVTPFAVGLSQTLPADSFPASKTYYVRHVNTSTGCASALLGIDVTVNPTPAAPTNNTPTSNLTICAGQTTSLSVSGTGTIEWFDSPTGGTVLTTGNTYTTPALQSSTSYFVSAKTGNCASPRTTVAVQVNGLPNSPTNSTPSANLTRCVGQTTTLTATSGVANATINWYDVPTGGTSLGTGGTFTTPSLSTNTTYYVAVKFNSTGCESARIPVAVTVNANPTASITPATVSICEGASATLTASGGTQYSWSNGGGSNASATFSPTTNTTYTVTVTDANNCSATASRQVTVNANPTASISPASPSICNGASASLTASGGTGYSWSNGLGSGASKTVSPTSTTTYTVTVTNAASCSATATVTVTVNTVNASINGPTTICSGLSATLTASGGTSYAWSNSGGSNAQATFTPTQTTTYTVTVTGAGNCTATASQTVSVQSAPTATITGPTEVCAGNSVTLTANGGNTYTWANSLGTNPAITVSPTQTTTYTVTVSIGPNCTATATQTVTVKQPSASQFSETICFGESFTFKNQALTQSGTYRDTINNAAGCDSIITLNLTVRNKVEQNINASICSGQSYTFKGQQLTQAGLYFDTLQTTSGCDSFITLNLTVNSFVTGSINAAICQGASYTFKGQQLTQSGSYNDTLTSVGGCDSIVTLTLTVNALPQPTITQNGNVLSTQNFSNYQWQLGGNNINGATDQTYTATQNGNYTVLVTDANGCSNTSAAVNVTGVGMSEISDFRSAIYPNPTESVLNVESGEEMESIQISDLAGRIVFHQSKIINQQSKIDVSDLSPSTYFIRLTTTNGKTARKTFVKQ